MRRIPHLFLGLAVLGASAATSLHAQAPAAAPPAPLPERAAWEELHRSVQAAALTPAACTAKFATQLSAARNAAQAYLRAVAADTLLWIRESAGSAPRPPQSPQLTGIEALISGEAAEAEARLKELALVRSLAPAVEAVRQAQERARFEWRSMPDGVAALESRLAPLPARAEAASALLDAQKGPLLAEGQRLQTLYDLLEEDVSRRCARSAAPPQPEDPFAVPTAPPRRPSAPKKN